MSVLILSVVALSVSVTLLATGITAAQNSLTETATYKAKAFVNACNEEAIDSIRADNLYTGTITLSFTDGDCSAVVTDISGTNKRIETEGTSGDVIQRSVTETTQIYPQLIIDFEKQVADF